MGASAGTHAALFALWAILDKLDQTLSSRAGPERPNSFNLTTQVISLRFFVVSLSLSPKWEERDLPL